MGKERGALVALALLFGLAVAPALLVRPGVTVSRDPVRVAEPVVAPASSSSAPTTAPAECPGVPVYPGATRAFGLAIDQSVVEAINALGLTPRLQAGPTPSAPFSTWTAGIRHGRDLLSYYARRMRRVSFWEMTARLRTLIGVRTRGTVDSPPLLYVSPSGAVLLRPHPNGTLDLVVLCPASS
jgi:hypothetical protein